MATPQSTPRQRPWFAQKRVAISIFKINRRPRSQGALFGDLSAGSFIAHVNEVLLFGVPQRTGRRFQREWLLGNSVYRPEIHLLLGQIGWTRADLVTTDRYNKTERAWFDIPEEHDVSARSIFVIDGESQELAILRHPSFVSTATLAEIFTRLLSEGEAQLPAETAEWEVEPKLNPRDFYSWLADTDVVERVTFVATRPNPEGLDAFGSVWRDMDDIEAKMLREEATAANPDTGLRHLDKNQRVTEHVAMSERGYGYVRAKGRTKGRSRVFDQREEALTVQIEGLPESWTEAEEILIEVIVSRRSAS